MGRWAHPERGDVELRLGKWTLVLLAVPAVAAAACADGSAPAPTAPAGDAAIVAQVHRSATCGCCGEYERYLQENGFRVETVIREDLAVLKQALGIPQDMGSCHTTLIDGYFVEGHAPAEVITRLLQERPDVDGISLPGMPAGAPGMEGTKDGPWTIYAILDGIAREYVTL